MILILNSTSDLMNKFIKFIPFGNNVLPIYDPTESCSVVTHFDKVHGILGRHILIFFTCSHILHQLNSKFIPPPRLTLELRNYSHAWTRGFLWIWNLHPNTNFVSDHLMCYAQFGLKYVQLIILHIDVYIWNCCT